VYRGECLGCGKPPVQIGKPRHDVRSGPIGDGFACFLVAPIVSHLWSRSGDFQNRNCLRLDLLSELLSGTVTEP
jgi:hypothetical protein